jgi:hypothetical protein
MRSLILLGAAGFVAASPAPAAVGINLSVVTAAADPSATGPSVGAVNQTSVYNAAAASSNAVAAVTGIATASATASVTGVNKRGLEERNFCIFGICIGSGYSTSTTTTKGYGATPTPTPTSTAYGYGTTAKTTAAATTSSTAAVTTGYTPYYQSVPTTCTPVSWTNTFAFTSNTACPTPYEVDTYCGFKNPEDPCSPQPDGKFSHHPVGLKDLPR